jgi:iron-sulfur cluster repair protein YtfE (RIC family)
MKITEGLLGEHALSYSLFDQVERITDDAKSLEELIGAESLLSSAVLSHAALEDEVLFPALVERGQAEGPLDVMRAEHKEIELLAAAVRASMTLEEAKEVMFRLIDTLREHFGKEERVLFPMCERLLGAQKLMELGEHWARRRGVG